MGREIRVRVLDSAENNPGPVSGANAAALSCDNVKRLLWNGWIIFLGQVVPGLKSSEHVGPFHCLRSNRANAVVVVPQTKENCEQNENGDDGELPAPAKINQDAAQRDPASRRQEQDGAHADVLPKIYGCHGEGDKERERKQNHGENSEPRAKGELTHAR